MQTLPFIHKSPETAYIIADYPYSFQLRCTKRVWIEYKPNFGYRVLSQTTNPRKTGTVWNKPHAGIYHNAVVLFLDENGHVQVDAISAYRSSGEITAFKTLHAAAYLPGLAETQSIEYMLVLAQAWEAKHAQQTRIGDIATSYTTIPSVLPS